MGGHAPSAVSPEPGQRRIDSRVCRPHRTEHALPIPHGCGAGLSKTRQDAGGVRQSWPRSGGRTPGAAPRCRSSRPVASGGSRFERSSAVCHAGSIEVQTAVCCVRDFAWPEPLLALTPGDAAGHVQVSVVRYAHEVSHQLVGPRLRAPRTVEEAISQVAHTERQHAVRVLLAVGAELPREVVAMPVMRIVSGVLQAVVDGPVLRVRQEPPDPVPPSAHGRV